MLIWKGTAFLEKLHNELEKRLIKACIHLENAMKKNLSTKAARDGKTYITGDSVGDFPHLRSGELRRSITHTVDSSALVGQVGSNKLYGRFLNEGTNTMTAREWLNRTWEQERQQVEQILAGKKIT